MPLFDFASNVLSSKEDNIENKVSIDNTLYN